MTEELYNDIISVYKETRSVLETANRLGTYPIKVRRVLITENLWSSKRSRRVAEMIQSGMTVEEIAEELDITDKNVQSFLPYTRGSYGRSERTSDAVNSENYRMRNRTIAGNQISGDKDRGRTTLINDSDGKSLLKLHLEVPLFGDSLHTLRRYGKVRDSLSRDILVPSDMTLLALHYAIQRAFGWDNGHLHHFELDYGRLLYITDNSFMRWSHLCGLYFRFPRTEDEYYWDDDYDGSISFRSWLKKQYTAPYRYGGTLEHLTECRRMVDEFIRTNPSVPKPLSKYPFGKTQFSDEISVSTQDLTVEEACVGFRDVAELGQMLERLPVGQVLFPKCGKVDSDALDRLLALDWTDSESDPVSIPITDTLMYRYGFDTGWMVDVKCTARFDCSSFTGGVDLLERAKKAPVCLAYDGVPTADSDGGLEGYCRFLVDYHNGDESERKWAREIGWTDNLVNPDNLL